MIHPNAQHWQGQEVYSATTGGRHHMRTDTSDYAEWSEGTGFVLKGRVLDIGCGSGRMAEACDDYTGVDITPSFVEFCQDKGLNVSLIEGSHDLPEGPWDSIIMSSVMTHMDHADRVAYLAAIRPILRGEALIDILPGQHDTGSVHAWRCDPAEFAAAVKTAGFKVVSTFNWTARDGWEHRYYRIK